MAHILRQWMKSYIMPFVSYKKLQYLQAGFPLYSLFYYLWSASDTTIKNAVENSSLKTSNKSSEEDQINRVKEGRKGAQPALFISHPEHQFRHVRSSQKYVEISGHIGTKSESRSGNFWSSYVCVWKKTTRKKQKTKEEKHSNQSNKTHSNNHTSLGGFVFWHK